MITQSTKHDNCEVEMFRERNSIHYARIQCLDCDKHIKWISKSDLENLGYDLSKIPFYWPIPVKRFLDLFEETE